MPDLNPPAVLVAAAAAFAAAGAYYSILGERLSRAGGATGNGHMPPWKLGIEIGRCLALALVVAGVAARAEIGPGPPGVVDASDQPAAVPGRDQEEADAAEFPSSTVCICGVGWPGVR